MDTNTNVPAQNPTPVTPTQTYVPVQKSSMTPVLVLLVIVLLIGVGGLGFYLYRQNQERSTENQNTQQDSRETPNTPAEDRDEEEENNTNDDRPTNSASTDAEARGFLLGIQEEFESLTATGRALQNVSDATTAEEAVELLEGAKSDVDRAISNIRALPRVAGDEDVRSESIALFEFVNTYLDDVIEVASDPSRSEDDIITEIESKTADFQTEANERVESFQQKLVEFAERYPNAAI